ncbi:hypothetical protein BH20ACT2_BH20ACT2_07190 [soil metagenome]
MSGLRSAAIDRSRRTLRVVIVVIVALGATGSFLGLRYAQDARQAEEDRNIARAERTMTDAITDATASYGSALEDSAALFAASTEVTRSEFRAFFDRIDVVDRYPGMQGMGVIAHVPESGRDAFLAAARADGAPAFAITPPGSRAVYDVILFDEPAATFARSWGRDARVIPGRSEALDRARDSGRPAITGPVVLAVDGPLPEARQPKAFVLYAPIYEGGAVPASLSARRERLIAWTSAPFRAQDFLAGVVGDDRWELDVSIYDGPRPEPERLIASTLADAPEETGEITGRRTIPVHGRSWTLEFSSAAGGGVPVGLLPAAVGGGGLLMTALLVALVVVVVRSGRRELHASQQLTGEILGATNDAFISMDRSGSITAWNAKAEELFGWSAAEAIGRRLSETIIPPDQRESHEQGLQRFFVTGVGPVLDQRTEVRASHRDGHELPVELTVWAAQTEGEQSFNAFVHDISERRDAEEHLRSNERRLLDAQQTADLGSWEWDIKPNTVLWSEQMYRIRGLSPEDPVGPDAFLRQIHPDDQDRVLRAVRATLVSHEPYEFDHRIVLGDGTERILHARGDVVLDAAGLVVMMRGTSQDVTQTREVEHALVVANARLQELAATDSLTGLPNRALFSDRIDQALAVAQREHSDVAVLFIDLDRFKDVNDSLGHHCGDELLVEVSRRLAGALRVGDTVARLGGDEFGVLLSGPTNTGEAAVASERILAAFQPSFVSAGVEFFVSASIGVALLSDGCGSRAELLQHADAAMYVAKNTGGARFHMFQPAMDAAVRDRLSAVGELRRAVDGSELFLRYHPQIDLASGDVVAVEALVRWNHPGRGEIGPAEFISLAEDSGLIVPIGAWVLAEACRQAARWRTEFPDRRPLRMAVNVSPRQLAQPGFIDTVVDSLAASGLPPEELELEIVERTLIADTDPAVWLLRKLRSLGVNLAIDDFGTGYSSLAYLQRFPVDRLKLDMSFIAGLGPETDGSEGDTAPLVAATIDLAHALGVEALAEGVETEEQRDALVAFGCDQGQGYLWTVPLRGDEITAWLAAMTPAPGHREAQLILSLEPPMVAP